MRSPLRLLHLLLALAVAAALSAPAFAGSPAEGLRVFYIGNSFTQNGNIPDAQLFFARQRGKTAAEVGRNIRWGGNLVTHSEPPYSLNNVGFTPWNIGLTPEKSWDALILQTWDANNLEQDTKFGSLYLAAALSGNPDVQCYLYHFGPKLAETWEKLLPSSDITYAERLADRLSAAFPAAKPVLIIPAGRAQWEVREATLRGEIPGVSAPAEFFEPDNHFNHFGAYIIALTHYATLYREDPTGLEPRSGPKGDWWVKEFPPEACPPIQKIVWQVVKNYPRSGVAEGVSLPARALPPATAGRPYSAVPVRIGGAPPFQWKLVSGALPAGLAFDPTTGRIHGVPTAPESTSLAVTVLDSSGATATATLALEIGKPVVPPVVAWSSAFPPAEVAAGAPVGLEVSARDADGRVARVEFFADGEFLGHATDAPWRLAVPTASPALRHPGVVTFTARAIDDEGHTTPTSARLVAYGSAKPEPAIPYFPAPGPVIDGEREALWGSALALTLDQPLFGSPASGLPAPAARFGWNETFFFALVEVPDSKLTFEGQEWNKVEQGDAVRLTLDSDARDDATARDTFTKSDLDMFFRWGTQQLSDKINSYAGLDFYQVKLPGGRPGRLLEVKIPWALLATTPAAGRRVGLDVRNYDDDDDGPVERILGHAPGAITDPAANLRVPSQLVRVRLSPPAP